MTTFTRIDLNDPSRTDVRDRALVARTTLDAARRVLEGAGYRQIRFDQWQHPTSLTLVETGYTYGEARLVVHIIHPNWASPEVVDLRMIGGETNKQKYLDFKNLVGASKHA